VRLFETGLRFVPQADGQLDQIPTLAFALTGNRLPQSWADTDASVDFFDAKGDVESLLARTGQLSRYRFVAASHPALHPGQTARIEKADADGQWLEVGVMGALHPSLQKPLGVKQALYLVQLDLAAVREIAIPDFSELSKFPEMRRDLALVVAQDVQVDQVLQAIRAKAGDYLTKLNLFDVYVGKGIDPDRKSLALGLTWQHPSRTLTDEEVNDSVSSVLAHLEESLGATLRG